MTAFDRGAVEIDFAAVGRSSPAIRLRRVDLPLPLGAHDGHVFAILDT